MDAFEGGYPAYNAFDYYYCFRVNFYYNRTATDTLPFSCAPLQLRAYARGLFIYLFHLNERQQQQLRKIYCASLGNFVPIK